MIRNEYLIRVQVGDIDHLQSMDGQQARVSLGHRMPWVVERVDSQLVLKHKSGQAWEINNEFIENESAIDLPVIDENSPKNAQIFIKQVKRVNPVFTTLPTDRENASAVLRAFRCSGDWVLSSAVLETRYIGRAEKRKAFTMYQENGRYVLKVHRPEVQVHGLMMSTPNLLQSNINLTHEEVLNLRITYGSVNWRFGKSSRPMAPASVTDLGRDPEGAYFKKTMGRTIAASIAIFALLMGGY